MGNLIQELLSLTKKDIKLNTNINLNNTNGIPILIKDGEASNALGIFKSDYKVVLVSPDKLTGKLPFRNYSNSNSFNVLPWNGNDNSSNTSSNSEPSFIYGGLANSLNNSSWSSILNGYLNSQSGSTFSFIFSGYQTSINNSGYSVLIGGYLNNIVGTAGTSSSNFLGAGSENDLTGQYSFLGAGARNTITAGNRSVLVGGCNNTLNGATGFIGGGSSNNISATGVGNVITGGGSNAISLASNFSVIVGGANNSIPGFSCTIIAGNGITADRGNTLFANNLSLKNLPTSAAGLPAGSVWNNGGVLNIV